MNSRNLPWVFLGLAIVLAIVAIVVSAVGTWEFHEHPHDSFSHVADSFAIHVLESSGTSITLLKAYESPDGNFQVGISKFMLLELLAAVLIVVIFVPMARRLASGEPPRGAWDNAFDSVLVFFREEVAKPNLGEHDADKYVPFLWTLFLFLLFNNLLGLLPWMGSPTANLYMTGALALMVFLLLHAAPIVTMGPIRYALSLWPHVEVVKNPWRAGDDGHGHDNHAASVPAHAPAVKPSLVQVLTWIFGKTFEIVLCLGIYIIELFGILIKSSVLAVRLFANMFAGHTVLAMILGFIVLAGNTLPLLWGSITAASVLGVVALSLLELFTAFLQAYIFVFLASLFIGMALHPSH